MPSVGSVIETSVKAFAKDITKFLTEKRAAKVAKLKKTAKEGDDPDKMLVTVTFEYSGTKDSLSRSPEEQAEYVSKGTSWTCAGAHMVDKARHVRMFLAEPDKKAKSSFDLKAAFGSDDKHFLTLSDLKTKWNALMKTHALKNHNGGDGWGEGDAFHFELAESKVPLSDKRVQACLIHYADITRIDGKPKNTKFENSSWKTPLKPHIKKAEEEAKRREDAEKIEELKKLKFDGSLTAKSVLLQKANKSASITGTSLGGIDIDKSFDGGAQKVKKVETGTAIVWDSLARDVFEFLGLTGTNGFDVKLSCGISYNHLTYDYLSQTFISDLKPKCVLIYNTPAAFAMKMSVTAATSIKLSKSGSGPTGTVVFDVLLTTPIDTEKGEITVTIDGAKATTTAKMK